jgi:hypothetical protein
VSRYLMRLEKKGVFRGAPQFTLQQQVPAARAVSVIRVSGQVRGTRAGPPASQWPSQFGPARSPPPPCGPVTATRNRDNEEILSMSGLMSERAPDITVEADGPARRTDNCHGTVGGSGGSQPDSERARLTKLTEERARGPARVGEARPLCRIQVVVHQGTHSPCCMAPFSAELGAHRLS